MIIEGLNGRMKALDILNFIYQRDFQKLYPQICLCLRIFISIPMSVTSGERSFSKLRLIKNRLRSTMLQDRLSRLMLLSIENDLAKQLDYNNHILEFSRMRVRRKVF